MIPALPSRGLRGYAGAIVAGGISAIMLKYALAPPASFGAALLHMAIACMVMIPLLIAGLGAGIISGLIAAIVSVAVIFIADPLAAFSFGIMCALPAVLLTALALRHHTGTDGKTARPAEGDLFTAMILYACAVFLAVVAVTFHLKGGLLALTTAWLDNQIAPFKDLLNSEDFANLQSAMPAIAETMPSILGFSWILFVLLSAVIAQSTLMQQNWQLRPRFDLRAIVAPGWLIYAVAATGLAGVFTRAPFNYISTNLCVFLCLLFFIAGLSVVHVWAATKKEKIWILTLYYLLLSLPWTLTPVFVMSMLIGISDHWLHFRQRFAAKTGWKKGGKL